MPEAMPAESANNQRVAALTGIRFFAASYVFIYHYGASAAGHANAPGPAVTFLDNGYVGVSMFFILSGFILSHAHFERPVAYRRASRFFRARIARIYPVYLFALAVSLPLAWRTLDAAKILAVLSLTQSWGPARAKLGDAWVTPAWTLSLEWSFYLAFPLLASIARRCSCKILAMTAAADAAVMIAGGVAGIHPGDHHTQAWAATLPLPCIRGTEFFYGILLYHIVRRLPPTSAVRNANLPAIAIAAALPCLLALSPDPHLVSLAASLFGMLLCALFTTESRLKSALQTSALFRLGAASYALYITQYAFHTYCVALIPHGRILALPICTALSLAIRQYIEEPGRRRVMGVGRKQVRPGGSAPWTPAKG
jgi:peptidoglycan/LPS O-acetylase OafA/YrhL